MRRGLLALLLLLAPALALGQAETTGRVQGRVVDEQGNPVSGATITLTSPAMQGERTFQTDENGSYLAALLPPGQYTLVAEAEQKSPVTYNFRVGVGQTRPLDITLKPGVQVTEEISVTGEMSRLETTTGGENFNYETEVEELPIVNRDPERVAELAPNISFGPTPNTLSISGAPSFDTVVLLDGAEVSDPYFGSAPPIYLEEALEEVQVLTSGISARYGRFQGGVINATTKSGGNTFDGTARVDFSKETWNQKTPFVDPRTGERDKQSDELNKVYSLTFGGPIVKDRLWFFLGGRTIPTQETTGTTALSAQTYTTTVDEDRWQVKLTGAITPNHTVEGSFLDYSRSQQGTAGLPAADLRALAPRDDPRDITTLEYQGVLTNNTFLSAQGTRKRVSILSGATTIERSPFLDFYGSGFQIWNNSWWDFNDPSVRDNDTLGASLTHVLSAGDWGDHTLEGGVQYVRSTTAGENRQSASGFNLLTYDSIVSGNLFSDVDGGTGNPNDPRFNVISLFDPDLGAQGLFGLSYRWEALPLGGDQELENTALYLQDSWEKGRWRVEAGLRWEQYDGRGPEPTLDLDFDELSPRLGVMYNMDNNWQLQATWGKYVSRFNDNVASTISGVGGAPYIVSLYTGPTQCPLGTHCLTYDDVEAILRDDANWGIITTISDPTQPTRFLADDATAPYANELNIGVKRALPRNSGTLSLTYTNRDYKNLLDDFVGGLGISTVTDPKGSGATFEFDTTFWDNAAQARREYEALALTWDYRPGARWDVGGNWTYAQSRGNYEGEGRNTPSSGSIIGDYPNSIPSEAAFPFGYTDDDIRHRVRAWASYRFDFGRAGNLALGTVGLYQSGLPYNLTGSVALGDDPTYLNEAGTTYTHFIGGRGNNRLSGFWRADLSARYQFMIRKDFDTYVKLNILNVTNEDQLVSFNTGGSVVENAAGVLTFVPGSNFGKPRSRLDYQSPRSYFVSLGVTW